MSRRYWGAKHEGRKERLRRWLVFSIHPKNSDTARDLGIRVTTTILTGIPLRVCGRGVEGEEQGRRGRKITGKRERPRDPSETPVHAWYRLVRYYYGKL